MRKLSKKHWILIIAVLIVLLLVISVVTYFRSPILIWRDYTVDIFPDDQVMMVYRDGTTKRVSTHFKEYMRGGHPLLRTESFGWELIDYLYCNIFLADRETTEFELSNEDFSKVIQLAEQAVRQDYPEAVHWRTTKLTYDGKTVIRDTGLFNDNINEIEKILFSYILDPPRYSC